MKNFKMAKVMGLILSLAIVATGCRSGGGHDETAAAELKAAMTNNQSVKASEYTMNLKGTANVQEKADDDEVNLEFDIGLSGIANAKDPKNPQFSMKIAGTGSLNGGDDESAEGEVRVANNKVFFTLAKLSDFDQDAMTMAMIQPSLGKWWYVALPAEIVAEMQKYDYSDDESKMTPEQKEMKELFDKTDLMKNVQKGGEEDFNGVKTVKYTAELDKEAFMTYVKEASKIAGEAIPESELAEIDRVLDIGDVEIKVWVATEDQTVRKLSAEFDVSEGKDQEEMEKFDLALTFEMTQSNLDGDLSVEEPEGAQLFDLMGMMMGGMGSGAMMDSEDMMMDAEGMMDADDLEAVVE
ncbi:MAG: hypothetical protein AAB373_06595 [Patescibacteria group bacterium]